MGKTSRLLQRVSSTGLMTLVSRVLGLVRDIVVARLFGAGVEIDAFLVAFRLPNFLRRLFAEGAFAQSFVPVLGEYRIRYGHERVQALIDGVAMALAAATLLVTLFGILAAPLLIAIFAPGFQDAPRALAVDMLRVTFPYLPLISLAALAGAALNVWGRFAAPAFAPVLLNLSLIVCAIWLAPRLAEPVHALAWGVPIAGVLQLGFLLWFLQRLRLFPRPTFRRERAGVRRVARLMAPGLFAVSVAQINTLVDTVVASFLVAGSISWLYYSDRVMEFPVGVFGIALATVILPALSEARSAADSENYRRLLDWGLRWGLFIGLPAAAGLIVLAEPITIALFQYDRFSPEHALLTGASLVAYAIGLPCLILVKQLAAGCFARQDTVTPVRAGAIAVAVNLVLNLLLYRPLGHVGLALATSMAAAANAALLYRGLRRTAGYVPGPGWPAFLFRCLAACVAMAVALRQGLPAAGVWLDWPAPSRAAALVLSVATGMVLYVVVVWGLGLRPRALKANLVMADR